MLKIATPIIKGMKTDKHFDSLKDHFLIAMPSLNDSEFGHSITYVCEHTDAVGFVGASSLERMAVEKPLADLTREFKSIPVKRIH